MRIQVETHNPSSPAGDTVRAARRPFTVAIMQPYFIPYAGYFRLFAASDVFVVYDCVQFPRRGWVHRNRLLDPQGREHWLTLPLEKGPQDILIRDLRFPADAGRLLAERLRPFRLTESQPQDLSPVLQALRDVGGTPVDYIERLLQRTAAYLGLRWDSVRSSQFDVPASYRGQDRIMEIARRMGARRYLNSPGGRDLYDPKAFEAEGIELSFLPDYPGPFDSILTRMLREDRDTLARDIRAAI
jgi:hypothetical protein